MARDHKRLVTPAWRKAHHAQVEELRAERLASPDADTALIVPAAQHPLREGRYAGREFTFRLKAAFDRFVELKDDGKKAEFYLPGSRHHDTKSGQDDQVALYDVAGRWLVSAGVDPEFLHGKDWHPREDVYSGAAEIRVAAAGFQTNPRFETAEYFCSPGQQNRAEMYALAYGLPLDITVPASINENVEQFHASNVQRLILEGLANTIDPYGDRVLSRLVSSWVPADGNTDTVPELVGEYAMLPWHQTSRL